VSKAAGQIPLLLRRMRLDRHLAPVLSVVLAGVFISTLVAYFYTKHTVENLVQGQITQAMNFLDREVTTQAHDLTVQSGLMAQEEMFRLAMEDSYLGRAARVAAQRKLESYVNGGAFDRVFLLDQTGQQILSGDPHVRTYYNLADRDYFQQAMRGRSSLGTVINSKVTGKPILVAASPLIGPDGTVTGVAVGLLHTATFAREMLNHLHIGQSGGAYILCPRGSLLATPDWAEKNFFAPGANAAAIVASAAQPGMHSYTRQGSNRIYLARKNEATGWVLVVEADEGEVLAPANRLGTVSGTISFITLALVGLALGALRRAMARLRNSEANQRTLTELSPVGIVTFNPQGRPEYMNRQARTILGLGQEDALPDALVLDNGADHPLEGADSPIARVLAEKISILGMQAWYVGPDGDRKALFLNATLFGDDNRETHGVMATLEDITERIRDMQRLHESEERFSSLFRLSPDSIVLSELDSGIIVDVNETFLKTHGITRENTLGKSIRDLGIYADDAQRADIVERVKQVGHALNVEVQGLSLSGTELNLSLSSQGIEIGGKRYRLTVARDIGERIRVERSLRENRRLLESILNTVPLSIFWKDKDSHFLGCNATFAHTIGWSDPRDIIGKTDFDLPMTAEECEAYRKDDVEVMRTLEPKLRFVEPLTLTDGRSVWLETSKLPLLDDAGKAVGVLGIFEDITERINAVEKLKQSEERFSTLFRLSPEPTLLIDVETREIADANEAFNALIGLPHGEIEGRTTLGIGFYADPADRDKIYQIIDQRGKLDPFEFEARRSDGTAFACEASAQTVVIGERAFLLAMMRDISEAKKIREMMIQTEKMISVGGIAAGIAHEINNPLGIVLQAAQNLVQRTRPDFKKNLDVAAALGLEMNLLAAYMRERKIDVFIEDIRSAAVRASAIIRHMLDFSRHSESRRKVCDLPAIIDKAVALAGSDYDLKKSYDFKHIKIVRDYADDLPVINCTETEIEQVVLNLLRNAAQALATRQPPQPSPCIGITLTSTAQTLRIKIADNGPGMQPEVQRRVFEPFFTTKPPGVGTGLGLSVSYFIVTKGHGGKMGVTSKPGEGTVFTIDLPRDAALEGE